MEKVYKKKKKKKYEYSGTGMQRRYLPCAIAQAADVRALVFFIVSRSRFLPRIPLT